MPAAVQLDCCSPIDYRYEDRKKFLSEEATLVPLWIGLEYLLFKKTWIFNLVKRTVIQPGGPIEDTSFKPGIDSVKF
jgi:hypothetical protein